MQPYMKESFICVQDSFVGDMNECRALQVVAGCCSVNFLLAIRWKLHAHPRTTHKNHPRTRDESCHHILRRIM